MKGIDVYGLSEIDELSPLHAAILLNDVELVGYLLSNNADPLVLDRDRKLNSMQFLELLIEKDPLTDRKQIIQLFGRAK